MLKLKFLFLAFFLCSIGCTTLKPFIPDLDRFKDLDEAKAQKEFDTAWGKRMAVTLPVKVEAQLENYNQEFLTMQMRRQLETSVLKYPNLQIKSLSEQAEKKLCKSLVEDTNPSIALPAPFYVFQLQLTDLIIGGVSFGSDQSVGNENIVEPSNKPQSNSSVNNMTLGTENKTEQNVIRVQLTVYEVKKNGTILKVGSAESKAEFGKEEGIFKGRGGKLGYGGMFRLEKFEDIKEATMDATALSVYYSIKAIKARIQLSSAQ